MAQGKKRRRHRSQVAAAGLTGPPTASSLHSVETYLLYTSPSPRDS
ncbi:hypothetical protein PICSAR172_04063 [Mycobacterium avium subsp. paratuberculosis]|nr:hypothetical protein PICSAR172_04063 [Mycobacterium avium subsp. paratuberculosis]